MILSQHLHHYNNSCYNLIFEMDDVVNISEFPLFQPTLEVIIQLSIKPSKGSFSISFQIDIKKKNL